MPTNSTHIALICAAVIVIFGMYQGLSIEITLGMASVFLGYAGVRETKRVKLTESINKAKLGIKE